MNWGVERQDLEVESEEVSNFGEGAGHKKRGWKRDLAGLWRGWNEEDLGQGGGRRE